MCGYFYKIHVHQHEVTNNPKYMTKNRFVSKTVSDFLLRKCWEKWSNPKTEWITIIPFHPFPIASPTLLPRPGSSAGSPTGHPPMKRWRWVSHPRYGCEWSPQRWIAEKNAGFLNDPSKWAYGLEWIVWDTAWNHHFCILISNSMGNTILLNVNSMGNVMWDANVDMSWDTQWPKAHGISHSSMDWWIGHLTPRFRLTKSRWWKVHQLWGLWWFYPLVNIQKTMENHHF